MSEREVAGFDEAELGWIEARFEDEMRVRRSNQAALGLGRELTVRILEESSCLSTDINPCPKKALHSKAFNSTERYCLTF